MSLTYLVDTNTVSKLSRVRPPLGLERRFDELEGSIALSVVSAEELLFGVATSPPARRPYLADFVDDILRRFAILPYNEPAALWVAQARASLKARNRTVEHPDLCFAGIAATSGLIVVTENLKIFTIHRGLRVENWLAVGGSSP